MRINDIAPTGLSWHDETVIVSGFNPNGSAKNFHTGVYNGVDFNLPREMKHEKTRSRDPENTEHEKRTKSLQ